MHPEPLPIEAVTEDLLGAKLHALMAGDTTTPKVAAIATLLDAYAVASRRHRIATIARALGVEVVMDSNDPDTETLALLLSEAVQELPEFGPAEALGSPASAFSGGRTGERGSRPPEAPEGPSAGRNEGERLVMSEAMRRRLDAKRRVRLIGGVVNAPVLRWFRGACAAEVDWITSDAVPRTITFDAQRDAGVILLQGLMSHNDMDLVVAAAKAAGIPFARANMPGRGALRRAFEMLDRAVAL